jgi:uncharacterized iron-regulated protein
MKIGATIQAVAVSVLWASLPLFAFGQTVDFTRLPEAQIVILGEIHDNKSHHDNQALAIASIAPTALVFEMLGPAQAEAAAGVDTADMQGLEAALGWQGSGWPEFSLYHPLFTAAPEARLYGAALARDQVRRAFADGAATVFGNEAGRYGLTDALAPAEQAAREADQQAAHCNALPVETLPGMVAAQRLRDAAFARTALQALAETGGPVVVITGSGHADNLRGIPVALAAAAPQVTVLSVGQIEGDGVVPDGTFDLWLRSQATPRGDPCAAFAQPPG